MLIIIGYVGNEIRWFRMRIRDRCKKLRPRALNVISSAYPYSFIDYIIIIIIIILLIILLLLFRLINCHVLK